MHQTPDEPHLILVYALHGGHFEAFGDLEAQAAFLPRYFAELVAEKSAPGYVVVVVCAGVADVAGMEDLLDSAPFVGCVALEVEIGGFSHGAQPLEVITVEGHICAKDQPCHNFLGPCPVLCRCNKVQIRVLLKKPPKMSQMHVLKHRLIPAVDGQLGLCLHLKGIGGTVMIQIMAEASSYNVEIFLIGHDMFECMFAIEALIH